MSYTIAIDGTAGSGKGSVAKALAKKLNFYYLDTGAIYRSITYYLKKNNVNITKKNDVENFIPKLNFKIDFERDENNGVFKQKNILNNEDISNRIRTEEISEASSYVSQIPSVREFATKIQHQIAEKYNVVMEGRDIGTVVLPNANYKFFLTASLKVRAKRRMTQLDLPQNKFKEVMKEIEERDFRDINRKISPLKRAVDAIFIDNSNQSLEETVEEIFSYIKLT